MQLQPVDLTEVIAVVLGISIVCDARIESASTQGSLGRGGTRAGNDARG